MASTSNQNISPGVSSTYAASSTQVSGFPREESFVVAPQEQEQADTSMMGHPTDILHTLADLADSEAANYQDEGEEFWEGDDDDDGSRFINYFLLSHIAMQLRDKTPRGTHVKGSIPYSRAFTGKDIVVSIPYL